MPGVGEILSNSLYNKLSRVSWSNIFQANRLLCNLENCVQERVSVRESTCTCLVVDMIHVVIYII